MQFITYCLRIIGTVSMILGAGPVQANESPDPMLLLQKIKTIGATLVYQKELRGGAQWAAILKGLEAGQKPWIEVAAAIASATDGGPAESLHLAAGIGLVHSPREVLVIAVPQIPLEGICGYPELADSSTDTQEEVVAFLDARIKAVRKLSGSDVADVRRQCLQALERTKQEVLGPKSPFALPDASEDSYSPPPPISQTPPLVVANSTQKLSRPRGQ